MGLCAPQVLDIVYLEGWFFRTFRNVLLKSTRSTTAPAMVPHTAIRFETSTPAAEVRHAPRVVQDACVP